MLTIYALDLSPFALKVLYVANALGLEYEKKRINLAGGEGKSEEYLKVHPAGKVPAMQEGDFTLFESNAIIRYLADKNNSDFYPKDLERRALVDQWIDFVTSHIQNGMGRVVYNKLVAPKFGLEVDESSLKCGYEFIERFLPIVDAQLAKTPYLAGDTMTLADFALLAHTDPLEAIEVDVNTYPHLNKWREPLKTQDFYQKVHKFYGESMMASG